MNDDPVVAGGRFQPSAQIWAGLVNGLRKNSSVARIELSIGGDQTSFANIRSLIDRYGAGPGNPLYVSLQVLNSVLSLDAVNYDDESEYDLASSTDLASMGADVGMHVSICPYTNQSYWVELVTAINRKVATGTADAVYLQCYGGGAGNVPAQWSDAFESTGLGIAPGLWATHLLQGEPQTCTTSTTASQTQAQMSAWAEASSLAGGWMYCGTDMMNCTNGGSPAEYATAILDGLNQAKSPPRTMSA
jgi:hypothetical protein